MTQGSTTCKEVDPLMFLNMYIRMMSQDFNLKTITIVNFRELDC